MTVGRGQGPEDHQDFEAPGVRQPVASATAHRAHMAVLTVTQVIMAAQLVLLLLRQDWPDAFFVVSIMAMTLIPALLRLPVEIPSEIQIVALLFVFASLK
jgi:hypothetical protein